MPSDTQTPGKRRKNKTATDDDDARSPSTTKNNKKHANRDDIVGSAEIDGVSKKRKIFDYFAIGGAEGSSSTTRRPDQPGRASSGAGKGAGVGSGSNRDRSGRDGGNSNVGMTRRQSPPKGERRDAANDSEYLELRSFPVRSRSISTPGLCCGDRPFFFGVRGYRTYAWCVWTCAAQCDSLRLRAFYFLAVL